MSQIKYRYVLLAIVVFIAGCTSKEAIEKEAYSRGYEAGDEDGYERGYEEGHQEGYDEAYNMVSEICEGDATCSDYY